MSPANVYRFFASKSAINEAIAAALATAAHIRPVTNRVSELAGGDVGAVQALVGLA